MMTEDGKIALFAEKCKLMQSAAPLCPGGKTISITKETPHASSKELQELDARVTESENHI